MNILGITFLAVLLEGTINYFVGDNVSEYNKRTWIKYFALLGGIALAIGYQLDIPSQIGLVTNVPFINYIVSGIIIGRGSNYVNDIISTFKK